jgi:hypothetical protein
MLWNVNKCELVNLKENFEGTYLKHVFSKAYQYATTIEKVYMGLKYVYVKYA